MNFINTNFGNWLIIDLLPWITGILIAAIIFKIPPIKKWHKQKVKKRLEERLKRLNQEENYQTEQAISYQQQQPHKETYEEFKARREREQAEQQNNNGGYSTVTVFSGVAAVSTMTGLLLPIFAAGLL